MRITNSMISDRVVFNMQRAINRYMTMENQMSTGRKIDKPSDDPIGIQRDLNYRTELIRNEQYNSSVHRAQTWMQKYDTSLSDMKNLVSSANEIAIVMANGNYDATARNGAAEEVSSILDQLIQIGNTKLEGRSVFSGHRTNTKAFEVSGNGVVYNGDTGHIKYQIDSSSNMNINLIGSEVLFEQLSTLGTDADLNIGVTNDTLLDDLLNGEGIDQTVGTFTITDENLGINATIDISGMTTVDDLFNPGVNAQLALAGITDLELKLGDTGNNLLLDITTPTGEISDSTSIDRLNSGNGLDLEPGKILVTDGVGVSVEIDLSGSTTVGDIRNKFNTQMTAAGYPAVTMDINASGKGFKITDATGPPALGLSIEEAVSTEMTALELGIRGDIDPNLIGTDLEPLPSFAVEEISGSTAEDLGIIGTHNGDFSGNDLDPNLLATSEVADLSNRIGMSLGQLVINQGDKTQTIDLSSPTLVTIQDVLDKLNNSGLDITASINADGRGIQIVNNDSTKSFIIENDSTDDTAKRMQLWGSSDILGSVILLRNALQNNDQEGTGKLLANMDDAMQHLLINRSNVGSKSIRLESTLSRLEDQKLSFTELLSNTEDADMAELITDLAVYENNYKSALMASARIVQPTLLDFLR
ncbi:MAG: flagellar hook-associated protein FlgL [candidate division Zixibacteria bacterium]|nr:flagellar hook-associated protein FlgL [candidate division Zixibacteria bacterium]